MTSTSSPMAEKHQPKRWFKRKRIILPVIAIVALGIGLGVGLGVGLKNRNSSAAAAPPQCTTVDSNPVRISQTPPVNSSQQLAEAFLSYAIEFNSFPSFAGNASVPNTFSDNLLNNIGNLTGTKPYVRVGGNSQDLAVYSPSTPIAVTKKQQSTISTVGGTMSLIDVGDVFFQSYSTWPNVKFIHGLNMQLAATGNVDIGYTSLQATIPLACQALSGGKLLYWEYGNEANLYPSSTRNYITKRSWGAGDYISQWQNGTSAIQTALLQTPGCESMASGSAYGYIAPSFWLPANSPITLDDVWSSGLNANDTVKLVSMHIYGGSSADAGVSIASTLLNHTWVQNTISPVLQQYTSTNDTATPLIIGETNSLYDTGIFGLTNTFAAALWSLDHALWIATQNVTRMHIQQGVGFAYNSWQPLENANTTAGTKPPYYGNLAAAAALGNSTSAKIQVAHVDLGGADDEAAYATYQDGALARMAVLNMRAWNASAGGTRPEQQYSFKIPGGSGVVSIQRLLGPGSDATAGVSWDGASYDVSPNNGLASAMSNVTTGESVLVCNETFSVTLQDSSAVVLNFSPS